MQQNCENTEDRKTISNFMNVLCPSTNSHTHLCLHYTSFILRLLTLRTIQLLEGTWGHEIHIYFKAGDSVSRKKKNGKGNHSLSSAGNN